MPEFPERTWHLTPAGLAGFFRAVNRASPLNSSTVLAVLAFLALFAFTALLAHAAVPFNEATVTRLQNKVSYGEQAAGGSSTRPAAVQDVIRARNFLLTETNARAELQYNDGSIVRVGQNTVFTFEADSRTLSLSKGTFIFYVPKGQGGGLIKTPSLTAAITGTVGKVSPNMIVILEGSVRLVPSGRIVSAGQFARRNPDGSITIDFYNPASAFDGQLMTFNGLLPPFRELDLAPKLVPDLSALARHETLERTVNHPSSNNKFFPEINRQNPPDAVRQETETFVPSGGGGGQSTPSGPGGTPGRNPNY